MPQSSKTMEALTAELNSIDSLWEKYKQRRKTIPVPEPLSIDQINQNVRNYLITQNIPQLSLKRTMLIIREMLLKRMQADPELDSELKRYIARNYDKLKKDQVVYNYADTNKHFSSNIDANQTAWRWVAKYSDYIKKASASVTVNQILINIVSLLNDPIFNEAQQNKQQLEEHLVQQMSILQRANYERETSVGADRPSCLLGSSPILVLVYESHPAFQKKITDHEMVKKKTEMLLAKIAADEMQLILNSAKNNANKKSAMIKVCEILSSVGLHTVSKRSTPEQIFTTTHGANIYESLLRQRKLIRDKYYPTEETLYNAVAAELPGTPLKSVDRLYISTLWNAVANEDVRHLIYAHYERLIEQLPKASPQLSAAQAAISAYQNLQRNRSFPFSMQQMTAVRNQCNGRLVEYLKEINARQYANRFDLSQLEVFATETIQDIKRLKPHNLQGLLTQKMQTAISRVDAERDDQRHKRHRYQL